MFDGTLIDSKTEFTLTLIISSWSRLDLPYENVLIPIVDASSIVFVKLLIPKNWVKDFDV